MLSKFSEKNKIGIEIISNTSSNTEYPKIKLTETGATNAKK